MPEVSNSMLHNSMGQDHRLSDSSVESSVESNLASSVYDFDCSAITEAAKRWKLVEELFHAALAVPEPHRQPYLALACAGDTKLQSEVESLLAFDQFKD